PVCGMVLDGTISSGGAYMGYFIFHLFFQIKKFTSISSNKISPKNKTSLKDLHKIIFTFILVCITYIFFRAENLENALNFIKAFFNGVFIEPNYNIKLPN